jgi:hypothetical protein
MPQFGREPRPQIFTEAGLLQRRVLWHHVTRKNGGPMSLLSSVFTKPRVTTAVLDHNPKVTEWVCRRCTWRHVAADDTCIEYIRGWKLAVEHSCQMFPPPRTKAAAA